MIYLFYRWPLQLFLCLMLILMGPAQTLAHSYEPVLIQDLEMEDYLKKITTPIWLAAGLPEENLSLYIIRDPSVNAFTITGEHIFVFTGLLTYVRNSQELMGILAHETGHIAAGHATFGMRTQKESIYMQLASAALGIAAIAMGAGGAGMAIMAGGMSAGMGHILTYTRTQEASADQSAATFLDKAHMSGKGMLEILQRLSQEESTLHLDPNLQTHPLLFQRLQSLEKRVKSSLYYHAKLPPTWDQELKMIQAKLHGFLDSSESLEKRYGKNQTPEALYARAISDHRFGKEKEALKKIDQLIAQKPHNPYIFQIKGQFFLENGQPKEALQAFDVAARYHKPSAELLTQQAQALERMDGGEGCAKKALRYLLKAQTLDKDNPFIFYELSLVYGKLNQIGMAELSLAQKDLQLGNLPSAQQHAHRAQKYLSPDTPSWLQTQDILMHLPVQ